MGRVAILKIGQGDFHQGFEVSLEIKEDSGQSLVEIEGRLPANLDIEDLYQTWEQSCARVTSLYRQQQESWDGNDDQWEIDANVATNVASSDLVTDCHQKVQCLENNMQRWLQSSTEADWQKVRERLAGELNDRPEEIRLIVKARKAQLWKLPWHAWDLLSEYPDVGVGYSPPEFKQPPVKKEKLTPNKRVRILAVLGDSQNIDLEPDRQAIKRLKHTETVFLEQPSSRELIQRLRDKNGWHIFFFAGHSRSESQTGRIYINPRESLTIDRFKNALQEAIAKGLKIAIFNSCDGLGLAQKLADLHIPVTIVMREIVSDKIAQSFVREFLSEYTSGQPLYTAVRRAQARLEEFTDVPGATWWPLIFQNPAVVPPSWQGLLDKTKKQKARWSQLRQISLSSLILTSLVMGIRWFGALQPLELWTYNRLMQLRAGEVKPDPRLLIVTVDRPDLDYQESENMNRKGSLSDEALSLLLDKLETLHPTTIGLDIYHPQDFAPALATRLRDNRFFAICKARSVDNEEDLYGVPPPREIPPQNWGFSDVLTDENDVVRRHLLTITPEPTDPCSTKLSFSSLVALHYLAVKHNIEAELTAKGEWEIGNVVFQRLTKRSSGYQGIDGRGYQILLNYRFYSSVNGIARSISLQEILRQGIPPNLANHLSEPIVIIGNTDKSYRDYFHTPYGEEIPGVFLQAQMISQILSAVLDQRPLLWWWNGWLEAFWVWGWSIAGGILAIFTRHPLRLVLYVIGTLVAIFGICFAVFCQAGWIPLVPSVMALFATTIAVYKLSTE